MTERLVIRDREHLADELRALVEVALDFAPSVEIDVPFSALLEADYSALVTSEKPKALRPCRCGHPFACHGIFTLGGQFGCDECACNKWREAV